MLRQTSFNTESLAQCTVRQLKTLTAIHMEKRKPKTKLLACSSNLDLDSKFKWDYVKNYELGHPRN